MDAKVIDEILDAILPPLEAAESQTTALTRFLRERGILTDDDFARFQEEAANAAEIRGRALRLRMHSLVTSVLEEIERTQKREAEKPAPIGQKKGGPPVKEQASTENPGPRAKDSGKQKTAASGENAEKPQDVSAPEREDEPQKKAS